MAGLLDLLQSLDGGQPNAGLMQAPAPQGNIADALKGLVMSQQPQAPQGMLLNQMQQSQVPQQPIQQAPQIPQQSMPAGDISTQIQQMLGARQPTQPNMASDILSSRFQDDQPTSLSSLIPSMQDMNQAAQAYQNVPTAQDYLSSLGHIGTGNYQTAQDIASARTQDLMKQLSGLQSLSLEKEKIDQGKYQPVKDVFGNMTGVINGKTGQVTPLNTNNLLNGGQQPSVDMSAPSPDPQAAAQQILAESGTPNTPVMTRQDITGRNAQQLAYRNAATGAKQALNNLNNLESDIGQYSPGGMKGSIYHFRNYIGMDDPGAAARTQAEKESGNLSLALMNQTAGAKGSGIRMAEYDQKNVPGPDMNEEAQRNLIAQNKAQANLQIQRGVISDLYPRMSISNINSIMDNYEQKNPPTLPSGQPNPKFMPYTDWLAAGRPNTAVDAFNNGGGTSDRLASVTGTSIPGAANNSFSEGQTATNPQTGQKAVFSNGQWRILNGQ